MIFPKCEIIVAIVFGLKTRLLWPKVTSLFLNIPREGIISNFATGSLSSLFYHCYQIWYRDCLKYENRMRLVGTPFVPHWHYFDITKLPYQKQYPRHLLKSLRKWKFHCWVDLWWSSTIFRMNMTESCLFVNWRQFYDEYPSYDKFFIIWCVSCPSNGKKLMMNVHHIMQVHHMMGIHHTLRVPFLFCNQNSKV